MQLDTTILTLKPLKQLHGLEQMTNGYNMVLVHRDVKTEQLVKVSHHAVPVMQIVYIILKFLPLMQDSVIVAILMTPETVSVIHLRRMIKLS